MGGETVVVVDDHDGAGGRALDRAGQCGDDRSDRHIRKPRAAAGPRCPTFDAARLQRGGEIGQELQRLSVVFVDGQPGDANVLIAQAARPFGEQAGLAEARRRVNQGQPAT